ncbi:hypothetical protein [Streptomyces erythrochromogenes]|uniref:hypothetical protein n=1 Tax=Streptomyces erythrochromogenes TaxID=285574 RepID=UPI0036AF7A53
MGPGLSLPDILMAVDLRPAVVRAPDGYTVATETTADRLHPQTRRSLKPFMRFPDDRRGFSRTRSPLTIKESS